jgi:hypothetical protein
VKSATACSSVVTGPNRGSALPGCTGSSAGSSGSNVVTGPNRGSDLFVYSSFILSGSIATPA